MKNLLLISGTGRKCGKTTLICSVIEAFRAQSVIAIKICPHFHPVEGMIPLYIGSCRIEIFEELQTHTGKDSSRMLLAGASKVYYIQVKDEHLKEAWEFIQQILPADKPVVCESGGLSKLVENHLHILVMGKDLKKQGSELADYTLTFDEIQTFPKRLRFESDKWDVVG